MLIGIEAAHLTRPNRTGVEEYCLQIINHLKNIIPSDVRVVLYLNKLTTSNEQLASDVFENLPKNWEIKILRWPLKKLWSQTRLAWELLFHPPDVFFAPAQLIPWIVPKKTVVMVHDSAFKVFPKVYHFWGRQYLKVMNWWILKKATVILTSSEFNKKEIERLYSWFDVQKVKVVPLAFDSGVIASHAYRQAGEASQSHGVLHEPSSRDNNGIATSADVRRLPRNDAVHALGITKPFILSVGRLEEKKNTMRIVEAFEGIRNPSYAKASAGKQDIQLVLVGKPGVGYEKIKAQIESSPFKKDILELGYVPTGDVKLLLHAAKAFIFPSLYEGFGIPVLEAMSVGCPVITSRGSALQEVAGEAALYVDPLDVAEISQTIIKLLASPYLQDQMRQKGLEQAKKYSWAKTAYLTWDTIAKIA